MTTFSEHTTAVSTGGEGLSFQSGTLGFDVARAPHVEGELSIAMPAADVLALLDPRLAVRVLVEVDATFSNMSPQSRTFDLGLRRRRVAQDNRTVTLSLASDEALLDDYAPLADDLGAYPHQRSLRAVINYVLGVVLGASLQASPDHDEDMRVLTDATNLSPNSGFRTNTAGWIGNGGVALTRTAGGPPGEAVAYFGRTNMGGAASGGIFNNGGETAGATAVNVSAGKQYKTTLWIRSSVAVTMSLNIEWVTAAGAFISATVGTPTAIPANTWTRMQIVATAPANAARAGTYCYRSSGSWPAGALLDAAAHRFSETPDLLADSLFEWFDGDSVDTTTYGYAWAGAASASAATRTALISRSPDLLRWPAGRSALEFLRPIVQTFGYRLVCDEQRRWTLRDEHYDPGGAVNVRQGVNILAAEDTLDRSSDDQFTAAVTVYTWKDSAGVDHTATDSFTLGLPSPKVRRFERIGVPYPGPGFSEYAVRRAQGRGRTVTVGIGSDWRALPEQFISATIDGAPILAGTIQSLEYDLERDEMTITTRTADIPAAAWVLIPADEAWLDSPVGESWIEEII